MTAIDSIPGCWSGLGWQQLCRAWEEKVRYGGNPDAARAAALLAVCSLTVLGDEGFSEAGERVYTLRGEDGRLWRTTARELSYMAAKAMAWFDYPYGDPGDDAVKDEKGKVVTERREPVRGYVNPDWRDAMRLPQDTVEVDGVVFALPQLAISNLTWEQYRSLQPLVPMLFRQGVGEEQALQLQAQFTAYCLVPEQVQAEPSKDRFSPAHTFRFDSERAEQSVAFWQKQIEGGSVIFHVCFQVYQTAVQYYEQVYPLLFGGGGKEDPLRDALTGEVGTINAVMKYAGYRGQQEVYGSFVPHVFDILNTMAKEAKEIESINRKARSRK